MEKKDQKAELKKNQTRRRYVETRGLKLLRNMNRTRCLPTSILERNETFVWRCRRRLTARNVGKTKVLFGTAAEALIKTKVLFGAAHEALIK